MRIIEMERLTMDGKPCYDDEGNTRDWWCVIETKEEELVYEKTMFEESGGALEKLWDEMIIHAGKGLGLHWGEDDIYGYFRPDETYPEVDEEFTDGDNDKWKRVW